MGNQSLKLDEARTRTPKVPAAEALRQSLHLTLLDTIKADDVRELARGLMEKALAGDLKAAQVVLKMITAAPPSGGARVKVQNQNAVINAPGGKKTPSVPIPHRPGSQQHDAALQLRLERGESLTHPADAGEGPDEDGPAEALRSRQAQLARHLADAGPRTEAQLVRDGFNAAQQAELLLPPYFRCAGGMWAVTPTCRLSLLGEELGTEDA